MQDALHELTRGFVISAALVDHHFSRNRQRRLRPGAKDYTRIRCRTLNTSRHQESDVQGDMHRIRRITYEDIGAQGLHRRAMFMRWTAHAWRRIQEGGEDRIGRKTVLTAGQDQGGLPD